MTTVTAMAVTKRVQHKKFWNPILLGSIYHAIFQGWSLISFFAHKI